MTEELPTLTISASDRLMTRVIEQDPTSPRYEQDQWEVSQPLPGVRIINSWQIYHKMWLVLASTDDGKYEIFLFFGGKFTLVHSHDTKIYNLFYVDDGHCLFCAEDGWWATTNTGSTWTELDLGESPPTARSVAVIGLRTGSWALVAYGEDHKIYRAEYPEDGWDEVYDTTTIWTDKWYPAIAGGPAGILAGAGSKLLRSLDTGQTWTVLRDLGSVIKSIVVSNQSTTPVFAITVEPTPGSDIDKIYLSYDLGDSLTEYANRAGSISSVQSVVPTGTNEVQTMFTVLGKRTADSAKQDYKIIEA